MPNYFCIPVFLFISLFWKGVDLAAASIIKSALNTDLAQEAISKAHRRSLATKARYYLTCTAMTCVVVARGVMHLIQLLDLPSIWKLTFSSTLEELVTATASDDGVNAIHRGVELTGLIFAGYILTDLIHILMAFPSLGGRDILFHHCLFLSYSLISAIYGAFPFAACWMLVGEMSTVVYNIRWAIINAGYGHTRTMEYAQSAFVLAFVARFAIYSGGLYHHLCNVHLTPESVPVWVVNTLSTFQVAGFFLNLFWLPQVIGMVVRPHPNLNKQEKRESAMPAGSASEKKVK